MITIYRATELDQQQATKTLNIVGDWDVAVNMSNKPLVAFIASKVINMFPEMNPGRCDTEFKLFKAALDAGLLHEITVDVPLTDLFETCQNFDRPFTDNPRVSVSRDDLFNYSLSVGDIINNDGEWMIVASFGYEYL